MDDMELNMYIIGIQAGGEHVYCEHVYSEHTDETYASQRRCECYKPH